MTRKDFELIAACLYDWRACAQPGFQRAIDTVAQSLAGRLATTNPRFNREKFLRACGVEN